ncbi:hypothetical protein D3C73_1486960 [compost metagenome]
MGRAVFPSFLFETNLADISPCHERAANRANDTEHGWHRVGAGETQIFPSAAASTRTGLFYCYLRTFCRF